MREVNDNPVDPLGNLGPAIKPKAAPAPDPIKSFEQINDGHKALETIAETLRKQLGTVIVSDGQAEDWEGLCIKPNLCHCGANLSELQGVYLCARLDCRACQCKEQA